jgi:excinuclease ABC subunit A
VQTCRGFGRVIGVDFGLVIPDEAKTLRDGAVRPWQTPSFASARTTSRSTRRSAASPLDTPWRELPEAHATGCSKASPSG